MLNHSNLNVNKHSLRCLSLLVLLLVMTTLSVNVYGQGSLCDSCPAVPTDDATHGTATIPWSGGSKDYTITVNGHSCTVSACFACRQTSSFNFDYTLTQFCIDSECFATFGITMDSLRTIMLRTVLFDNPCHFPCPTCPNSDIEWQENQMTCWMTIIIFNPFTGQRRIIHKACPTHGWCLNAYSVCCDANGKHLTFKRGLHVDADCNNPSCHVISCPDHL